MKNLVLVAARNVLRNGKRTLLTALAVFIGVLVVTSVRGILNGLQRGIKENVTRVETGDLQLHAQGYLEALEMLPLSRNLRLAGPLGDALSRTPEVRAFAGRIAFAGMISDEERQGSTTFFAKAIDIEQEPRVCPDLAKTLSAGRMPARNDASEIVVAKQLADGLHLRLGSGVTLATQTEEGAMNALDFTVVGIIDSSMPTANRKLLLVPLGTAQELLMMPGKVTEVAVRLDELEHAEATALALGASLPRAGLAGIDVRAWSEIAAFFSTIMGLQDAVFAMIGAILFVLVITGVVNTMLMTVFERVREIGTMMALGVQRRKILVMFVIEAGVIAVLGGAVGGLGGYAAVLVMAARGISFVPPGATQVATVQPTLALSYLALTFALAVVGAMAAALYPAWRASRLRPAEALRAL